MQLELSTSISELFLSTPVLKPDTSSLQMEASQTWSQLGGTVVMVWSEYLQEWNNILLRNLNTLITPDLLKKSCILNHGAALQGDSVERGINDFFSIDGFPWFQLMWNRTPPTPHMWTSMSACSRPLGVFNCKIKKMITGCLQIKILILIKSRLIPQQSRVSEITWPTGKTLFVLI